MSHGKKGGRGEPVLMIPVAPHVFKKNEIEAMMGSASKVKLPKEREQPKVGPVLT